MSAKGNKVIIIIESKAGGIDFHDGSYVIGKHLHLLITSELVLQPQDRSYSGLRVCDTPRQKIVFQNKGAFGHEYLSGKYRIVRPFGR